MKSFALGLALVSLLPLAGQVSADDAPTRATPSKKQMLRDCIRKHEAEDVSQSKPALQRLCKDEIKQQQTTGAMPAAPPTDVARDSGGV